MPARSRATTPIDAYLATVPEPQRSTLNEVRARLRKILPQAEECISYNMPAFKVAGVAVAGFVSCKAHCSYFPHSSSVLPKLEHKLSAYSISKGCLRFEVDKALPLSLLRALVKERLHQESAFERGGKVKTFYDNGVVQSTGSRKNGEMHGAWKWYRKDGSLMRSGSFKLGKQCGTWATWTRDGNLLKETKF